MFAVGCFPFVKIGAGKSDFSHDFGYLQFEGALPDLPFS